MQELLEDMQAGDARAGRGSATSASPHSTPAEDQQRRLSELQTAVRDLEAENKRLKEGLRPATTSAPTSNGAHVGTNSVLRLGLLAEHALPCSLPAVPRRAP